MKKIRLNTILVVAASLLLVNACATPCDEVVKDDCVCTFEYKPVCGCNDKTYGNACQAECAGITEYTPGKCQ